MTKFVYLFNEANGKDKAKFGGKGANLSEMTHMGLPVPPGFIVTTEACTSYYENGRKIKDSIIKEIFDQLAALEKQADKKFGSIDNPFLVSVRSGARASMPGMMDTILNLGLNDVAVEGLAKLTDNPRFAYDCYRRFIQMYSDVVTGIGKKHFETIIDDLKMARGIKADSDLTTEDLKELADKFKAYYKESKGEDFPQDPKVQLIGAIEAVFRSWENERAIVYRRMHNIPSSWGTAVNVQAMVFGNMGETSGTGVAFTRDPSTGENVLYGEYLMNAQGEDVVAGIRTPNPIAKLEQTNPQVYKQFVEISTNLERYFKDMQDLEFTIERGKLYILQTRNGKRTAQAAVRIAVELVEEGLCTKEEALMKIDPKQLDDLLHPTFAASELKKRTPIASGLAASPGAAVGKIAFTAEEAKKRAMAGEKVLLVRLETSPEDIEGINSAEGILTARGGMTSHAAVVARGMGRCCVAGCGDLVIDEEAKTATIHGVTYGPNDVLSLNGSTGYIYEGAIPTVEPEVGGQFKVIMDWANEVRRLKVRTNADTPEEAKTAVEFGAEGIGLCRTEHMFFEEGRIQPMREMILADNKEDRKKALAKILPMQRDDFKAIYEVMQDLPVTIRFLDPPLHEFLPQKEEDMKAVAKEMGITVAAVKDKVAALHEVNPMLGHRGCRLAITYPEIAEMQTTAVIEAAIAVNKKGGNVKPEIMIPLVGEVKELAFVKKVVVNTAEKVMKAAGVKVDYTVGTMIEIPRAAITADKIAKEADFFSFGTNDLTQMTFGFSRDDAAKFLPHYYSSGVFDSDPFATIDKEGVGEFVRIAAERGRSTKPALKLGICGEHGGDPVTVAFCDQVGLDYVSCSPYRVPIAILAAAQAVIEAK
ncbi:MAG: pyruvate, phosphate dikinase [Clostridiales bacterium]|jgi:pyruvate,orthophosphate dikinase|nr:pyruvate, phosphate dikinase [Clostridiales bacterium]